MSPRTPPQHGSQSDEKSLGDRQLQHIPVLLEQTIELLDPKEGETYLDLTAGYGGHARAVLERIGTDGSAVLVDRDDMAIRALQPLATSGARVLHTDFLSAAKQLQEEGLRFDMILADLGVSSPQFDIPERGFTLRAKGPLDMRMDQRQRVTAQQLVNEASGAELARIISRYGEEPMARRIARAIQEARPLTNTLELADVVSRSVPAHKAKDACVRTFQALRIAVNRELDQVSGLLELLPGLLRPGGRVAVISFHSLEDRLVKRFFQAEQAAGYEACLQILTKRPIAGNINDAYNPRARSAKLRAAVKITHKQK